MQRIRIGEGLPWGFKQSSADWFAIPPTFLGTLYLLGILRSSGMLHSSLGPLLSTECHEISVNWAHILIIGQQGTCLAEDCKSLTLSRLDRMQRYLSGLNVLVYRTLYSVYDPESRHIPLHLLQS